MQRRHTRSEIIAVNVRWRLGAVNDATPSIDSCQRVAAAGTACIAISKSRRPHRAADKSAGYHGAHGPEDLGPLHRKRDRDCTAV